MDSKNVEENEAQLLQELKNMIYPNYSPGCSETEFTAKFQPLVETMMRFDKNGFDLQDPDLIDKVTLALIGLLNNCFTHCPRRELMTLIMSVILQCKRHLKNLAVGRQPIKYSRWTSLSHRTSPIVTLYNTKDPSLRTTSDALYLKLRRIPHLELLLAQQTGLLEAKQNFENALLGTESRLPPHHHHYLAVIAASTFGSKYLWNRAANSFLASGGDPLWLQQGVTATPAVMQELSKTSGLLAYDLQSFTARKLFKNGFGFDREYMLEAVIVLSYYQCLACLCLTAGLISESDAYEHYLPKVSLEGTSYESVETIKKHEHLQSLQEQSSAEAISNQFMPEMEEEGDEGEDELILNFKSCMNLNDRKAASFKFAKKIQDLRWYEDEPQLEDKLQNLRCLDQLRSTFSKYVNLDPLTAAYGGKTISQEELLLASEWELELHGLKRLQSVMGWKVRGFIADLIVRLKGQSSKTMTHYYQFYNNYIHEFVNYTKLLHGISSAERSYLKLITKWPFLFTEVTFSDMEQELGQKRSPAISFALEAVGCKLELAVTLATLQFDRTYEEGSE